MVQSALNEPKRQPWISAARCRVGSLCHKVTGDFRSWVTVSALGAASRQDRSQQDARRDGKSAAKPEHRAPTVVVAKWPPTATLNWPCQRRLRVETDAHMRPGHCMLSSLGKFRLFRDQAGHFPGQSS